jgi:hypothetical protein
VELTTDDTRRRHCEELCFGIVFGMYGANQSAQMCSRVVGWPPQKMQYFDARAMEIKQSDGWDAALQAN